MQAVSSRPDVAPPSYTRELEKLQDQIPPFPNSDAMAVIEEDTGQSIVSLFSYISPEPIAAASLGQVREQCEIAPHRGFPVLRGSSVLCFTIEFRPSLGLRDLFHQVNCVFCHA